jgi:hypothetical protein
VHLAGALALNKTVDGRLDAPKGLAATLGFYSTMQAIVVPGWLLPAIALGSALFSGAQVSAAPQDAKGPPPAVDCFKDVRPILETRCYGCHGPKKQKADLCLD